MYCTAALVPSPSFAWWVYRACSSWLVPPTHPYAISLLYLSASPCSTNCHQRLRPRAPRRTSRSRFRGRLTETQRPFHPFYALPPHPSTKPPTSAKANGFDSINWQTQNKKVFKKFPKVNFYWVTKSIEEQLLVDQFDMCKNVTFLTYKDLEVWK